MTLTQIGLYRILSSLARGVAPIDPVAIGQQVLSLYEMQNPSNDPQDYGKLISFLSPIWSCYDLNRSALNDSNEFSKLHLGAQALIRAEITLWRDFLLNSPVIDMLLEVISQNYNYTYPQEVARFLEARIFYKRLIEEEEYINIINKI